ncbi:MAG: T9SS type A sorting domain-containing protein [Bacteroidales bacterium]|nr:T9SS type A sorting domain-containing protein [Bacteroidales bacterium]
MKRLLILFFICLTQIIQAQDKQEIEACIKADYWRVNNGSFPVSIELVAYLKDIKGVPIIRYDGNYIYFKLDIKKPEGLLFLELSKWGYVNQNVKPNCYSTIDPIECYNVDKNGDNDLYYFSRRLQTDLGGAEYDIYFAPIVDPIIIYDKKGNPVNMATAGDEIKCSVTATGGNIKLSYRTGTKDWTEISNNSKLIAEENMAFKAYSKNPFVKLKSNTVELNNFKVYPRPVITELKDVQICPNVGDKVNTVSTLSFSAIAKTGRLRVRLYPMVEGETEESILEKIAAQGNDYQSNYNDIISVTDNSFKIDGFTIKAGQYYLQVENAFKYENGKDYFSGHSGKIFKVIPYDTPKLDIKTDQNCPNATTVTVYIMSNKALGSLGDPVLLSDKYIYKKDGITSKQNIIVTHDASCPFTFEINAPTKQPYPKAIINKVNLFNTQDPVSIIACGGQIEKSIDNSWSWDTPLTKDTKVVKVTKSLTPFPTLSEYTIGCSLSKDIAVKVPKAITDLELKLDDDNNLCQNETKALYLSPASDEKNYIYSDIEYFEKGKTLFSKRVNNSNSISEAGEYKASYLYEGCTFETNILPVTKSKDIVFELKIPEICPASEQQVIFKRIYDNVNTATVDEKSWVLIDNHNNSEAYVSETSPTIKYVNDNGNKINKIQLTTTDNFNCTVVGSVDVIRTPELLSTNVTINSYPACGTSANGKVEISLSQVDSEYLVRLYKSDFDKTITTISKKTEFTKLAAGTYTIEIFDPTETTCVVYNKTVTVGELSDLTNLNATITKELSCKGGNDATIKVSFTGERKTDGFDFYLKGGSEERQVSSVDNNSYEFSGLSAAEYNIKVTDKYCNKDYTIKEPVPVINRDIFSASISNTDILCFGEKSTVTITPNNNDNREYLYTIINSNDSNVKTVGETKGVFKVDLLKGEYIIETENNICNETPISHKIEITQPDAPLVIEKVESKPASCSSVEDGTLTVNITGGTTPYTIEAVCTRDDNGQSKTYTAENVTDSHVFGAVYSGTYAITVTDTKGCTQVKKGDYVSITPITFKLSSNKIDCFGGSTGVLNVNDIKGKDDVEYSYTIDKSDDSTFEKITGTFKPSISNTSFSIPNLKAGNYQFAFSNGDCSFDPEYTDIKQVEELAVSKSIISHVSSSKSTDGNIVFEIIGGTGSFVYKWFDITNNKDIVSPFNLDAGKYSVLAEDINSENCSIAKNFTIYKPTTEITIQKSNNKPVDCKGNNTGSISFTPSGGWHQFAVDHKKQTGSDELSDKLGYYYSLKKDGVTFFEMNKVPQPFSSDNYGSNHIFLNFEENGTKITIGKLPAGDYTLTVYDAMASEEFTFNITEPDELKLEAKVTQNVNCYGGSDGIIELTASGGTEAYKFYKNNIEEKNKLGSNSITGLAANINGEYYTYSVEDAKRCQASTTATVEQPAAIDAVAILNHYGDYNITKNGGTDNITIKVNNGDSEVYKFSLGDSEPVETTNKEFKYNNLKAGSYNFKVSNGNCSFDINNVELKQPNVMLVQTSVKNVTCRGLADGSITADVTGGIPLGYKWTLTNSIGETVASKFGDNISPDKIVVDNLKPDTCTLKVENKFGDVKEIKGLLIKEPGAIKVSTKTKGVLCKSGDVIEISPDVNGGSGQYNFQWFNSDNKLLSTAETYNATEKGDYTLKVTDKVCSGDNQVASAQVVESLIVVYPEHELVVNTLAPVLSNNKYTVKVAPTGGSGKYQYSYKNDKFYESDMLTFSAGGVYSIYVKDSKGCVSSKEIYLDKIKKFEISELTISNPKCFGEPTGVVSANSVNGSGQVTYYLTLKSSANTVNSNGICQFNSLAAGEYLLYAKDSNGNSTESVDVVIANPEEIKITPSLIISPSCGDSNGEIEVVNSLNDNTVIYNWSSSSLSGFSAQGNSISNLKAGVYNVTANIYGCTVTNEISLNNPGAPVITLATIKNDDCGNSQGALSVNISTLVDSYDIAWNYDKSADWGVDKTTPDITGLSAGKYTVNVTDKYNCSSWLAHNITQLNLGNVSYNISQPTNDTPAGKVTLAEDFSFLTLHVKGIDNAVDKTEIGSIGNLEEGEYTLDIFNSQCVDNKISSSFTIYELPTIKSTITSNTTCFGTNTGELTILAEKGVTPYTYSIDKSNWLLSDKLTHLHSGSYTVYVKDAFNRVASKEFVIKDPEKLVFNIDENNPVKCFNGSDGSVKFKVQSGVEPILFGDNKVNQTLSGGLMLEGFKTDDYKAYVVDYNNCRDSVPFTISQPDSLQVKFTNIINTTCSQSNGSVMATAIGGVSNNYNFVWPESGLFTNTLNNIAAGKYPVVVTDNNNCETKDTVEIADAPAPVVTIANVIAPLCSYSYDGSIEINILGGTGEPSVLWNDSKKQKTIKADNLLHGTYKATVIDENNCKTEITHNLIAPSAITGYLLKNDEQLCHNFENGVVEVTGAGGTGVLSYSIKNVNDEAFDLKSLVPGIYTVTITDEHGCVKTIPTELKNPAAIEINTPDTLYLCDNETLLLDAGHPQLFHSWSSNAGIFSTTQKLDVNTAGNYFIKITDQKGCQAIDSVAVLKQNAEIDANFILSSKAFVGDTIVFIEVSWPQPDSIRWSIPEQLPVIAKYGDYEVHVKATQEGMFYPGVTTYRQGCFKNSYKSIQVEAESLKPAETFKRNSKKVISSAVVYPNPNNGVFTADIVLSERVDIEVSLLSASGSKHFSVKHSGQMHYVISSNNVALKPGVYILRIVAGSQIVNKRVVVK